MQALYSFPQPPCPVPPPSVVPEHLRQFILTSCGVNPKAIMSVLEQEPTKVYIFCDGILQCLDFGLPINGSSVVTANSPAFYARDQTVLCDGRLPGYNMNAAMPVSQNRYVQAYPLISQAETLEPTIVAKPSLESEILRNRHIRAEKLKHANASSICSGESERTVSFDSLSKKLEVNSSEWHRLTDGEREALQRERRKANAYKTALCQQYTDTGTCEYGADCRFAHGESELQLPPSVHPKYKTQLCNKFSVTGYCPYGSRCQFIHQRAINISGPKANLCSPASEEPIFKPAKVENVPAANGHNSNSTSVGKPISLRAENEDTIVCGHQPMQKELSIVAKVTHNESLSKSPVWDGTGHLKASTPKPCKGPSVVPVNAPLSNADNDGIGNAFSKLNFDFTNALDAFENLFPVDNDILFSQSCFPRLSLSPGTLTSAKPR